MALLPVQPEGSAGGSLATENAHSLSDALQHPQRLLQLFFRMRRRHDGADAGLSFRHGRERDARPQHALLEQFAREVRSQFAVADDDRRDRSLAGRSRTSANVKPQQSEFFLPEARVLPKLFHAFWFVF